jgi:hypothetical protein
MRRRQWEKNEKSPASVSAVDCVNSGNGSSSHSLENVIRRQAKENEHNACISEAREWLKWDENNV